MDNNNFDVISWNVRGLNATARCLTVNDTLASNPCHFACLQETKLHTIDPSLAAFLGAYRLNNYAFKPAMGTRGGILLLWNDAAADVTNVRIGRYSLSADVTLRHNMTCFILTVVYGPSRRPEKEAFLNHLRHLKPQDDSPWLLLGDFNMIYKARDKNNRNINLHLMSRFRTTLDHCGLKELTLQNRKYTWSNERRHPTLVRLDWVFCNQAWDLTDSHTLHALSSSHSDHCPLILTNQETPRRATPFKFENFWMKLPCFQDTVAKAWQSPTSHTEPFHCLGHKLDTTATALKKWSRSLLSEARYKLLMAQEIILRLDKAQDFRGLSAAEASLRSKLKKRILGWLVIEKARKKQCARISYVKEGDANTRFFHLRANEGGKISFKNYKRDLIVFSNTQTSIA
jgi:exonuclease III